MRYFDFLIEVCEWREDRVRGAEVLTPEQWISTLLARANPRRHEHLKSSAQASTSGLRAPRSLRSSPASLEPLSTAMATAHGSSAHPPLTCSTPAARDTARLVARRDCAR